MGWSSGASVHALPTMPISAMSAEVGPAAASYDAQRKRHHREDMTVARKYPMLMSGEQDPLHEVAVAHAARFVTC